MRNSKNIEKKKIFPFDTNGTRIRVPGADPCRAGNGLQRQRGEREEETDPAEMNEVIRERREDVELQTSVLITFITLISLMRSCRRFKPGEERDSASESKSSAPSAAPPAPPPHFVAVKVH